MKKRKFARTKKAILASVMSLLLSVSMFAGSTYAWFTDEVTSGVNQIIAGNLDVELDHKTSTGYESVEGETDLFKNALGNPSLWEPGAVAAETFKISNVGTLALKYKLNLTDAGHNFVVEAGQTDPTTRSLLDVIKVGVVEDDLATTRDDVIAQVGTNWTTLADFIANTSSDGTLYPAGSTGDSTKEFSVVLYWEPGTNDFDNQYNLKNGAYASDSNATDVGQLYVNLGVTLVATQVPHEEDSFDDQYDAGLDFPNTVLTESVTKTLDLDDTTHQTTAATTITTPSGSASVTIPAGVSYKDSSDQPITGDIQTTLKVEPGTDGNITIDDGNSSTTYEVSLVNVVNNETVTAEGTVTYDVVLDVGVIDLQKFYHQGNPLTKVDSEAELAVDTNYFYDQTNGVVKFKTSHFSPFTAEYLFAGGIGDEDYPYLIATAEQMEAIINDYEYDSGWDQTLNDKCYKLINDITLKNFTMTVSYVYKNNGTAHDSYSNVFFGTFDGGNHTINFIWDKSGDDTTSYAITMFGEMCMSLVKDLTINCDIDTTHDVGVLSSYTYYGASFENVKIKGNITSSCDESGSMAGFTLATYESNSSYPAHFKDCSVEANITWVAKERQGYYLYIAPYIGQLVGGQYVTMTNCSSTGSINIPSQEGVTDIYTGAFYALNPNYAEIPESNCSGIVNTCINGIDSGYTLHQGNNQYNQFVSE